ncbi:hypothetical protein BJX68DRAFT_266161 [Aspergillus pseudodeflectus]|uniref:GPR1/FUN34/yaaH family-domain-containing protein n=1 Tax=Aspergillus pseudodeflectus TaxID=176178 RepID=A0ABR4KG66_9EURO
MSGDALGIASTVTSQGTDTKTAISVPALVNGAEDFSARSQTPIVQASASSRPQRLGNPTPIALMGFLVAATPGSCALMGWRGADNSGGILLVYVFFGGLVQLLGGIGEWFVGNTFTSALFTTYGK